MLNSHTKDLEEKVAKMEKMLGDMHMDFEKCAQGISPCFFCVNDQCCENPDKDGCHFIWKMHN